ncbi:hypothetical protein ACC688_37155, partial [Rhizobium ruizarguesonis]
SIACTFVIFSDITAKPGGSRIGQPCENFGVDGYIEYMLGDDDAGLLRRFVRVVIRQRMVKVGPFSTMCFSIVPVSENMM